MKRFLAALRAFFLAVAAGFAVVGGAKLLKTLSARVGKVEDGDTFVRLPDNPGVVLVSPKADPKRQVEVVLPEGMKSSEVVAVKIGTGGTATVEVLK